MAGGLNRSTQHFILQTAKARGLALPLSLLDWAEDVIE
jgi:hypothetical protein